jgi:hypothetical protein
MKTLNIGTSGKSDFTLPLEAVTQTFSVLAKRGVGKTYTGCVMVEEMLGAGQQVIVADPIGVWWGLRSSADGKSAGYPIVVFGGEHADVPLEEHSGEIIAGAIIENGFSAILDLSLLRKGAQVRFMTAFAETLYRLNRKPLHFAVDEADAFCPQRPQSDEARLLGAFEDIVRRGRARGIGVTLITQRAAVINKNVLTQIEVLVCLRTIAPQDREAVDAWIEVHGTQKQRDEMMSHLASLPIGTAYFWSPGWLDIFKKVEVRRRRTFDSSSTPKVGEKIVAPKETAAVDLDKLGEQIKSTVERAKSNDPAELKKRIRELEKTNQQLADAKTPKPSSSPMVVRNVPALTDAERKRLTKLSHTLDNLYGMVEGFHTQHSRLAGATEALRPEMMFFRDLLAGKLAAPAPVARPPQLKTYTVDRKPVPIIHRPAAEIKENLNGESPKAGLRRMMIALAQRPGLNGRQLSIRSQVSMKGGSFGTYVSRGRTNGWITGDKQQFDITEDGMAALGDWTPLPEGKELAQHYMNELGSSGDGRMFKVLFEKYPSVLTKEELSSESGVSTAGGSFGTYLSRLKTLELITVTKAGIKASDEFFQ